LVKIRQILVSLNPVNFPADLPSGQLIQLFDQLGDVYFFIKDTEGKFIHANDALLRRLRLDSLSDIVGTTDHDRYPEALANRFAKDDRKIIKTGQALVNQIEVLFDELGDLDWYSTTKFPLRNDKGSIIGVMGIFRIYEGGKRLIDSYSDLAKSIEIVRSSESKTISVSELAHRSGISERQLHRRFQHTLGMTPQEFILRNRIQSAALALRETDKAISAIAIEHGFCDQSAFSKQFTRRIGKTPAVYRRRSRETTLLLAPA